MNVYSILSALSGLTLLGNNLPGMLLFTGYADECTPSDRTSILLGFIFSLLQLLYLARILRTSVKESSIDQVESALIHISPKLFPAFIYQIYFVAMTSLSHPGGEKVCTPIIIQQIGFNITAGVYAFIWIRGVLFGYSAHVRSKLLLIATQIFAFLMTNLFEIAIRTKYSSVIHECSYISHTGLLVISTIFAFISIGFLAFGAETAGFVLSLPISYIFWKPASLMAAIGWVVEYSGGTLAADNTGSAGCPYVQLDLMLWTLPFVLWFFFSLLMTLVRFFMLNLAETETANSQSPEPVEEGSPLRAKVFGKHTLPIRIAEEKTCSICWEEFIHEQNVSFVDECFHIYHSSCINKWVTHGNQCPLCKRKIKAEACPEIPLA
jgi:hypothetical protein